MADNKRIFRKITGLLCLVFILLSLCGCGSDTKTETADQQAKIVVSIFPIWDWTRNILGENPANLESVLLVDNGVDLHSYQPSVEDILTISTADIFIYTGGESDQWVTDALKQAVNPDLRVISLMDVLGEAVRMEELAEGMQGEEEANGTEADEHVWLSLRNAEAAADAICAAICELDPENSSVYRNNSDAYRAELAAMDSAYTEVIESAALHTLLFGDRFPFRYLTEDYGLEYFAAFSGCSAETEASFETITFLSQKCDELDLPVVLTIDGTDHRIAETIVQNTRDKTQRILTLDSMQSVTTKEIESGISYLSVMGSNLEILREALGAEVN